MNLERIKSAVPFSSHSVFSRPSTDDIKGSFGLNTLHTPLGDCAIADLIFVHGLGGGSQSTWTKSGDPALYWPQEWLPHDEAFQDVRIHSFGYDSNWDKGSTLGIQDFARALLGSILDCPVIPWTSPAPIVFVGHSMGGLVIKRAYILAKQKPDFASLADRVEAIFFLATPHRGSDLAQLLSKVLNLSPGARPFVTDLHRNSLATQSINDEFPQFCQDVKLCSFYETLPTSYGVGKSLVVGQDLATLGYHNERREYLNANHREVCKYDNPDDPNYRTVRNALASVTKVLRSQTVSIKRKVDNYQRHMLDAYLGVSDAPEDDLMSVDSLRMSGSCEWLIKKVSFRQWLDCISSPIYWISAKPGTGKTILSGKTITHLRGLNKHCSFYFFKNGDQGRSKISSFLLSMARQMTLLNREVLTAVLEIYEKDDKLSKTDYRTIWRRLFLEGILKARFDQTQYWVIDALDECKDELDIVPLLIKMVEICPVRIFLTSRNPFEYCRKIGLPVMQVTTEQILEEDSKSDIALYLKTNIYELPSVNENGRQYIFYQILNKSAGCFLWVSLVLQELRDTHTSTDVHKILDEVPTDMNELFARILHSMSKATHGKDLAKAILTWTVCSIRPLKTSELHDALQLDLKDSTDTIERSIRSCCGQLVYVNIQSQVQMIHLTARDYLLGASIDSEFAVDRKQGHRRLLLTCLRYLNGDEMKALRRRKLDISTIPKERSPFASYACDSLFEHILHSSWTDKEILSSLACFFNSSNVLSWIEYVAKNSELNRLIQTGKALGRFLQRSSEQVPMPSKEVVLLESWATDLVRLVMKFGKNLGSCPSSIFDLIPPFCPPATAPWKQFGTAARSISVSGLRAETWDDCLSTIVDTREQYSSLASSKTYFAIGTFSGKIVLYKQSTCQEVGVLTHAEPVRLLCFGEKVNILVSAGSMNIKIWDLASEMQLWIFDVPQQCMSITLTEKDQLLLGALKDHRLKVWNLNTGCLTENVDWTEGLEGMTKQLYRRPVTAAFSIDTNLLAIIYKGQDILLWDLEGDTLYDTYSRESGANAKPGRPYGSAGVRCLVFGAAINASLLASAYGDGELVLFDTSTGAVKTRIVAFAHILACSADGSTLASADPSGTIQLFDFETMSLLYRIHSVEPGIQGLTFSADGLRLLDIRGSHCRVWEPTVLAGQCMDAGSRGTSNVLTAPREIKLAHSKDIISITSIACHPDGDVFFVGKEDGSVYLYDVDSGVQSQRLFSHAHGVSIVTLEFEKESQTLSTVDSSSRILIHQLARVNQYQAMIVNEVLFDYRADAAIGQLICCQGLRRILVCSATSDVLWSLSSNEANIIATISYQDREPFRWARHPSILDHLVLFTKNEAHIYDWQTLNRLTGSAGILLEGSISPKLSIRSIIPCFNGTRLATTFGESLRPRSKSKLFLWNTSDFAPETEAVVPVPDYHHLADQVEVLIGTTDSENSETEHLIFLQNSNWVCSADSQSANKNYYVRHFFFPADWLSTNADLMVEVTQKGDIILVKRDEVVVVKRGLLTNKRVDVEKESVSIPTGHPQQSFLTYHHP